VVAACQRLFGRWHVSHCDDIAGRDRIAAGRRSPVPRVPRRMKLDVQGAAKKSSSTVVDLILPSADCQRQDPELFCANAVFAHPQTRLV
jgi:hypothetical protein